jgi:hypothetical protein
MWRKEEKERKEKKKIRAKRNIRRESEDDKVEREVEKGEGKDKEWVRQGWKMNWEVEEREEHKQGEEM